MEERKTGNNMRAGLARRLEETGRQGRENSRLTIAKVLLLVSNVIISEKYK